MFNQLTVRDKKGTSNAKGNAPNSNACPVKQSLSQSPEGARRPADNYR